MTIALRIPSRFNTDIDRLKTRLINPRYPRALSSVTPTITAQADYATTTIPNAQFVPLRDPRVGFQSVSDLSLIFSTAALGDGVVRDFYHPYNALSGSYRPLSLEIMTDAPTLELLGFQNFNFNMFIDDQPAQAGSYILTNSSATRLVTVALGSRAMRKLRFDGSFGSGGFAGFYVAEGDTVLPPAPSAPSFAYVGDSYLQAGGSGLAPTADIAFLTSFALGGRLVQLDAVGGTGIIQANGGLGSFTTRLLAGSTLTGLTKADAIFIMGGINDPDTITAAQVLTYLTALRTLYPTSVIVVLGAWSPDPMNSRTSPVGKDVTVTAVIKTAVMQLSGPWVFINNLDDSWINSSGASKPADTLTLTFTAALSAATSATLSAKWQTGTGYYPVLFSDGSRRNVLLTHNATTASWTTAVTASASATAILGGWQTGDGMEVTFTAALSSATSGTLLRGWAGATGSHTLRFSTGTNKTATLTYGSTAVSWSGAVTADAKAAAIKTTAGNAIVGLSDDGTHPNTVGCAGLARRVAERAYDGILAL